MDVRVVRLEARADQMARSDDRRRRGQREQRRRRGQAADAQRDDGHVPKLSRGPQSQQGRSAVFRVS
jgi:hypothetical protein